MPYMSDAKDVEEKSKYHIGFPKGLNTYQDASLVDDKNLTEAKNVIIDVDGVKRRPGTTKPFDDGGASYVYGQGSFYKKSAGTRYFLRMAKVGSEARLQYLNSSDEWEDISEVTVWTDGYKTSFCQARDKMFIYNGKDNMRYYDGSNITTYTSVDTPTSLSVTPTGSAGSTDYSYRVEALNATGRTAACTRVTTSTGNATLSTTNYNALAWDAMDDATAYNVYGRSQDGIGESYLATVYTNAYNDTGSDSPVLTLLPNENNTTGGIIAKHAIFTLGRQFAIGVTEGSTYYPTRIYYSGTLDYIDAFVGGDFGGGWVDVESNDGGEIVGIAPYQNGVLILKTNGLYKFTFTTSGLPSIDEITTSHGGVSYMGGQLIDNDYLYVAQKDNRIAIMVAGQQANYIGTQIRTNDIGIFISPSLMDVEWSQLDNICTFHYDYKFGFSYTTSSDTENSSGFVLDYRYGGWVEWDGLPVTVANYNIYDSGSNVYLYGGSNSDGYVVRLFEDEISDNGTAFRSTVVTKLYNQDMFNVKKVYRNPSLWFKYISGGSVDVTAYVDGNQMVGSAVISPSESGSMVGEILAGESLTVVSPHTMTNTEVYSDYPVELTMLSIARNIKFSLVDNSVNTNWVFMGDNILYTPLEGMPLEQQYKVYLA